MGDESKVVPQDLWQDVTATVTECRYQFAGLGNMAFGFSLRKKFRIAFGYRVKGAMYVGSFQSEQAVAQGEQLAVRYNPLDPGQNSLGVATDATASTATKRLGGVSRVPLLAFGVAGSVVLSVVWLLVMRGCR